MQKAPECPEAFLLFRDLYYLSGAPTAISHLWPGCPCAGLTPAPDEALIGC
jgi:hypothetical protein